MGLCTANAGRPTVDSRCRGTTISCCVADLKRCSAITAFVAHAWAAGGQLILLQDGEAGRSEGMGKITFFK